MRRRIVVTGGSGNIGSYVVRALKECLPKVDVMPLRRDTVDLRDRAATARAFGSIDPDVIVHAAAATYDPCTALAFYGAVSDVAMTGHVLEAAGHAHVVFLSSSTIYECMRGDLVEDVDVPSPIGAVGVTKLMGEELVRLWSRSRGNRHTIWRLFNVLSPLEPHARPGHVQVDLFRQIFVERAPEISCSQARRAFTWVGDVAEAIVQFMDDERTFDQTFNLGSGRAASITELASELVVAGRTALRDQPPRILTIAGTFRSDRTPDVSKARSVLGWEAPTSFADSVHAFVRGKLETQ
jgi:UDP-glucose 4-epimerase